MPGPNSRKPHIRPTQSCLKAGPFKRALQNQRNHHIVIDSIEAVPESECFKAQAHLYSYIFSHINGIVLKCFVQLDIPDIIYKHGQPITIPQLISKLEIQPTKTAFVERLVRFLVHNGFLPKTKVHEQDEEMEVYTLISSKLLIKCMEPNLAPMVLSFVDPSFLDPFDFLGSWFKQRETVTEIALGATIWEIFERDSQRLKSPNEAMASDSRMISVILKDSKSIFQGLESIVDVGGGTGTTCKIISEAYPHLKCIVFDRPHVVENCSGSNNLSYFGGDMFEYIPSADAVLLKAS
ncbi:isoflavone 7-O-methyltransferase-like [Prosopis cineraria]|uniref:isoflavone 7-O-methyltransferase-like n=1 Tax=Prosopis cineraria TaxID=364024 RepID=UPI0024108F18|nr:isoflavone 7-O-methyltransferase-like [Prosopis cineraria]